MFFILCPFCGDAIETSAKPTTPTAGQPSESATCGGCGESFFIDAAEWIEVTKPVPTEPGEGPVRYFVPCCHCGEFAEIPEDAVGPNRTDLFNVVGCDDCGTSFSYDDEEVIAAYERPLRTV